MWISCLPVNFFFLTGSTAHPQAAVDKRKRLPEARPRIAWFTCSTTLSTQGIERPEPSIQLATLPYALWITRWTIRHPASASAGAREEIHAKTSANKTTGPPDVRAGLWMTLWVCVWMSGLYPCAKPVDQAVLILWLCCGPPVLIR
jgi:hypothetical protein